MINKVVNTRAIFDFFKMKIARIIAMTGIAKSRKRNRLEISAVLPGIAVVIEDVFVIRDIIESRIE